MAKMASLHIISVHYSLSVQPFIATNYEQMTAMLNKQTKSICSSTVRSESRCALRLRNIDLVVRIEVAVDVCCCFAVFSR
jgi:hypothetical protein